MHLIFSYSEGRARQLLSKAASQQGGFTWLGSLGLLQPGWQPRRVPDTPCCLPDSCLSPTKAPPHPRPCLDFCLKSSTFEHSVPASSRADLCAINVSCPPCHEVTQVWLQALPLVHCMALFRTHHL